MPMKRWIVLGAAVALTFAGCSSDDETPSTTVPASTTLPAPTSTAAAGGASETTAGGLTAINGPAQVDMTTVAP